MNSKERVKRTINRLETDRVPFGLFGSNPWDEERMAKELGLKSIGELYSKLDLDIWHFFQPLKYIGEHRSYKGKPADFWGVPEDIRKYGDSSEFNPLADVSAVEEVEEYQFPKIQDFDSGWLDKELDKYSGYAIEGGLWAPIFHNFTWLCGFENALSFLITEPEIAKAILRKITDFWIDYAKLTLETAKGRIMIMQNCNDFGTQRELIMSENMFRQFFRPELQRLYDTIKSYDVAVLQHSCGAISPIIGDFIEMGADIINPLQVSAADMGISELAGRYGGQVCFYGGVDTQYLLPEGDEIKIREEVRRTVNTFKECGGYILAPSQGVEPDIAASSIAIMFDEGKRIFL